MAQDKKEEKELLPCFCPNPDKEGNRCKRCNGVIIENEK